MSRVDRLCLACSRLLALGLNFSKVYTRILTRLFLFSHSISLSPTLAPCAPVLLYFFSSSRAAGVLVFSWLRSFWTMVLIYPWFGPTSDGYLTFGVQSESCCCAVVYMYTLFCS